MSADSVWWSHVSHLVHPESKQHRLTKALPCDLRICRLLFLGCLFRCVASQKTPIFERYHPCICRRPWGKSSWYLASHKLEASCKPLSQTLLRLERYQSCNSLSGHRRHMQSYSISRYVTDNLCIKPILVIPNFHYLLYVSTCQSSQAPSEAPLMSGAPRYEDDAMLCCEALKAVFKTPNIHCFMRNPKRMTLATTREVVRLQWLRPWQWQLA